MSQFVSHYDVLGVTPHASHDEIRRAYRALAQVHHPDANPDGAKAAMVDINAAWDVLGDADKRRAYDRAIGTPPAFNVWVYEDDIDDVVADDDDPLAHLRDDPDAAPPRRRASDLLLFVPVTLLLTAVATFAFSVMSESEGLRTMAILLAPVTAASFLAAPLFMMMRTRSRDS